MHMLELDQLVGTRYLVTVHGPRNPAVDPERRRRGDRPVRDRMEAGGSARRRPTELSYAIGSAVARRQSASCGEVAHAGSRPWRCEVMGSDFHQPEALLEELFLLRHELLIRAPRPARPTRSRSGWPRSAGSPTTPRHRRHARDLADQFDRVRIARRRRGAVPVRRDRALPDQGHTKMTVAMERLAVIAAITLPVTAIASVYGMNVIVNSRPTGRSWSSSSS